MRLQTRLKTRLDTRIPFRMRATAEAVSRYFHRNEGSTDHATIPTVTLAGDFLGGFDFTTTSATLQSFIGRNDTDNTNQLTVEITTAGQIRFYCYNSASQLQTIVSSIGSGYNDGKVHLVEFSLVGTTATLTIDHADVSSEQWLGFDTVSFNTLYSHRGSRNLTGILANLEIEADGTLIRDYPLNDNSDILANKATTLGDKLNPASIASAAWNTDGAHSYEQTGVDFGKLIFLNNETTTVEIYVFSCTLTTVNGSPLRRIYSQEGVYDLVEGYNEFIVTLGVGGQQRRLWIDGENDGEILRLNNVSLRKADGYGRRINSNPNDWALFYETDEGWVGQEIAPDYSDTNNWNSVGVSLTTDSDEIKITALDGSSDRGEFVFNATLGATYEVSVGAKNGIGSAQAFQQFVGWSVPNTPVTSDAIYNFGELLTTATPTIIRAYAAVSGVAGDELLVTSLSIKEVLKNA
jgi:hypothetical protein